MTASAMNRFWCLAVLVLGCGMIGCQAKIKSSRSWTPPSSLGPKLGPEGQAPNEPVAELKSELTGVSLTQTGYLYSITSPKSPDEKCWYLAEGFGQDSVNAQASVDRLKPLTPKSMTSGALRRALEETQAKEGGWRDGIRTVLAACGVATPIAGKNRLGALAMAACGAGGLLAEKVSGDKMTAASTAGSLVSGDGQASAGVTEKKVVEAFAAALQGRTGDGSLDCQQALNAARQKKTPG